LAPEKSDPFHATRIPPEAPTEGRYSKQLKQLGQTFFKKCKSSISFLVSYKQTISQADYKILFLTASHFQVALTLLTFQDRTTQFLTLFLSMTKLDKNN
jgi:hypothetical protein